MTVPEKKRRRSSNRVTLEDIARHCGVHKGTVSRVLNGRLDNFPVSKEMIQRVEAAAEQLDYRANWLQRAIRTQRTHLIGLSFIHTDFQSLTPDRLAEENQIMGQFSNIILSHPGFKDYDLVFHERRESPDQPLRPSDFKTDLFDGIIYLTPSDDHHEFLEVASKDFPIILLGQLSGAEKKVPCIDMNNRKMGAEAVGHLIETGRRNILMLTPEKLQHINCIQDRRQGYRDALAKNGIEISDDLICSVRSLKDNVSDFLQNFPRLDRVDAIFCPTDDLATLCIAPLKAMGYRIPEDIALIGFGDLPGAQHTSPPLTTVRLPLAKQVYAAIDLLLKILNKETPYEPGFREIEAELVIRESTRLA